MAPTSTAFAVERSLGRKSDRARPVLRRREAEAEEVEEHLRHGICGEDVRLYMTLEIVT